MELTNQLQAYEPYCEQEARDRELMLRCLMGAEQRGPSEVARLFAREDPWHFTASAWVVSPKRDLVLMAYHNIYRSWSWLGGHADGERDLAAVALREICEESGVTGARLVSPSILSLETLCVDGHEKRGRYVSSHLHLNVTYLIEADPNEPLRVKPDENSKVGWLTPQEALAFPTETWFVERIYPKLIEKSHHM